MIVDITKLAKEYNIINKIDKQIIIPSQASIKMRKQQPTDIKILHKKFQFLNKSDIKVMYDFCDEDIIRTQKVLTIAKDTRNPTSIVRTLLHKPQKGATLLASLEKRYDQLYGNDKQNQRKSVEGEVIMMSNFCFFKYVPKDVLLSICMYLDPYSMAYFSMTSSKISKAYLSQPFSQYFKNLCTNLFQKFQPKLPQPCRFLQLRNYIFKQGNQFGPNTRNAVTHKLRYYVWQKQIVLQKKSMAYLQTFGSYRNLYFKLQRVHFNGIYACKHQYRKEEEKNLLTNTGQVHYISYYRYLRFFQDGTVISAVFPNKQKLSQMVQLMSTKMLQTEADKLPKSIMIGEYIQSSPQTVQCRLFKQGAIFTYILQPTTESKIKFKNSNNNDANDVCRMLVVKLYQIRVVDQKQIVQTLEQYRPQDPIVFKFNHLAQVQKENSKLISGSSL